MSARVRVLALALAFALALLAGLGGGSSGVVELVPDVAALAGGKSVVGLWRILCVSLMLSLLSWAGLL